VITLGITTYNQEVLWLRRELWNALIAQTDKDFELVIVDDNSGDQTSLVIKELCAVYEPPFDLRLFRCTAEKKGFGVNALPQNIVFKEARGEVVVLCDDDGVVDSALIEYVKSLKVQETNGVYYGSQLYIDPKTKEILEYDKRLGRYGSVPFFGRVKRIDKDDLHELGALVVFPTSLIRSIGGHEMENVGWRGNDARLGGRLKQVTQTYFVTDIAMRFLHFGLSWHMQAHKENRHAEIRERTLSPNLGQCELTPIANGGEKFWTSGILDSLYHEQFVWEVEHATG